MKIILLSLTAFLLGSIPSGLLIAKTRGIDVRRHGSGNIGATNVLRTAGKWPALLTLSGDVLKGVIAAWMGRYFFPGEFVYQGIVGLCSILGHNFSVFLKFKGGKGVATSLGVLSIYAPQTALLTIIIWLMAALITRYSSLGAIVSFGLMPVIIRLVDTGEKFPVAFLMAMILIIRHKDNIRRIIKGSEPKIGRRS